MMEPTCKYRCPEKKGTCFPKPCRLYQPPSALAAAKWRLAQCRKTVAEGEEELRRRREALRQAEIALGELTEDCSQPRPASDGEDGKAAQLLDPHLTPLEAELLQALKTLLPAVDAYRMSNPLVARTWRGDVANARATIARASAKPPNKVLSGSAQPLTPQWRCTRCGRDEIDCRQNGCERGPCPMEFIG